MIGASKCQLGVFNSESNLERFNQLCYKPSCDKNVVKIDPDFVNKKLVILQMKINEKNVLLMFKKFKYKRNIN